MCRALSDLENGNKENDLQARLQLHKRDVFQLKKKIVKILLKHNNYKNRTGN